MYSPKTWVTLHIHTNGYIHIDSELSMYTFLTAWLCIDTDVYIVEVYNHVTKSMYRLPKELIKVVYV